MFRALLQEIHREPTTGPLVGHCSAGAGRTGVLFAVDSAITDIERQVQAGIKREEAMVDVPGRIMQMRKRRNNMVQTLRQLGFIYEVLKEHATDPIRTNI
jgi:protein tyrosine phosphatase